jgi:NTE family protein
VTVTHVRRVGAAWLTAMVLHPWLATSVAAQGCAPVRTGLVLSGGGAKGFAHIGVFKVLDSLGIRPDIIVGSSIGAIAGALYASGYSGNEIDSLTRALPMDDVIRRYSPVAPGVIGALPAFAVWENNGHGFVLQTGAVREAEINALMSALMLRGNLLARGDFDRLPIPLRVIGTRLSTRTPVVLSAGDLAQAVRASFAIPLVLEPGMVGSQVLVDGGVSVNIPVAEARAAGAERLIISMLPTAVVSDQLLGDPLKMALQLADFLFLNDTSGFRPEDLVIRNRVAEFSPMDFTPATLDSLVRSGMQVARETFAKAGCVRTQRDARAASAPAGDAVPRLVTAVRVNSPRRLETQTLQFALGVRPGRRLSEDSLRQRLLRLGTTDDYRAIWLTPSGMDTSVAFTIAPVYGAKQALAVGLAYDNDLGGRMWGGFAWRDLFQAAVEASASVDIGKYRQEVRAGVRRRIPALQRALPLVASLRTSAEDVRRFTDGVELMPVATREAVLAAGISGRVPLGFTLGVTPSVRWWRSDTETNLGAVGVTLLLTDGVSLVDIRTRIEGELNTRYQRVHVERRQVWPVGRIDFSLRARVGWSRRAPIQQQFVLGGYDGFAGLRTTERRGDQKAMAGFGISRAVFGPLRASGEIMTGAVGAGRGFLRRQPAAPFGQLLTGGRLGGELRTEVLTAVVQRGHNSMGGDVWFVRLGRWF